VVKLLSIRQLHDGTAATISQAVMETMNEWRLQNHVKGLCFDTTASNTGIKCGVCIRLETEIGHELLNLACRHHISEIMLEKVFSIQILNHLQEVCHFVTAVYVRYWFQSPSPTAAPRNDLAMLCSLSAYPQKEVAKAATVALERHLSYLSELLVGFAIFDDEVPVEEQRLMVLALRLLSS